MEEEVRNHHPETAVVEAVEVEAVEVAWFDHFGSIGNEKQRVG